MKMLAQHGFGESVKISEGLKAGYVDGVIFRPRDIKPDKLIERCNDVRAEFHDAVVLFDPQLYAGVLLNDPDANIGKLEEYSSYFESVVIGRYESERAIADKLRRTMDFQRGLSVSGIIAPNILIRRSFDSRDAVVAKNFVRLAKPISEGLETGGKKVYATLAVSMSAFMDHSEFQEFLNDLTTLDNPPDGFYILVALPSVDARADLFHPDVLSAWMLLNYSLKINGFEIINGYSDLFSPFLSAVGADYGCTGWASNSRNFSLEQFAPRASGGRPAVQKYLSKLLLNRIRFTELNAWAEAIPDIFNELETDKYYTGKSSEPERATEVLQSWEALKVISADLAGSTISNNLKLADEMISKANSAYARLEVLGLRAQDVKSNSDHLDPLFEGIQLFRKVAEI
ncbi:MAG: hypothetical protein M1469_02005 [Bacteroidetes bacterium]|nr:hypothetical protein [Bacteroidota bacterium]